METMIDQTNAEATPVNDPNAGTGGTSTVTETTTRTEPVTERTSTEPVTERVEPTKPAEQRGQ